MASGVTHFDGHRSAKEKGPLAGQYYASFLSVGGKGFPKPSFKIFCDVSFSSSILQHRSCFRMCGSTVLRIRFCRNLFSVPFLLQKQKVRKRRYAPHIKVSVSRQYFRFPLSSLLRKLERCEVLLICPYEKLRQPGAEAKLPWGLETQKYFSISPSVLGRRRQHACRRWHHCIGPGEPREQSCNAPHCSSSYFAGTSIAAVTPADGEVMPRREPSSAVTELGHSTRTLRKLLVGAADVFRGALGCKMIHNLSLFLECSASNTC